MLTITTDEWDLLRRLADRARQSPERVTLLEQRWRMDGARPGAPYTLLVGPAGAVDLLLSRWLGPPVARALHDAGPLPLVIGPRPEQVQPPHGRWPGYPCEAVAPGHLLALRTGEPVTGDLAAALSGLGFLDQVVLVTRLSQPLPEDERRVARSLQALAAVARVLVVALSGAELPPHEAAELSDYAAAQVQAHGFDGRCLGAAVWFTEGSPDRPGALARIEDFLPARPEEVGAGRTELFRHALDDLLANLEKASAPPLPPIERADADEAAGQFHLHLAALGRQLQQLAAAGEFQDSAQARTFLLDTLRSWCSGHSLQAAGLDYIEALRPGTKAALLAEAQTAAGLLNYTPPEKPRPTVAPAGVVARFGLPLRRLAVALVAGLLAYGAVYLLTVAFLAPWLVTLLCNLAGMIVAVVAYTQADRWLPGRRTVTAPESAEAVAVGPLRGWAQVEQRLAVWFGERLRDTTPSLRQECARLRDHWHLTRTQA